MKIKATIALVFVCLLISCQSSQERINFETFSERFSSIQKAFKNKTKQVRSKDEYQTLLNRG